MIARVQARARFPWCESGGAAATVPWAARALAIGAKSLGNSSWTTSGQTGFQASRIARQRPTGDDRNRTGVHGFAERRERLS